MIKIKTKEKLDQWNKEKQKIKQNNKRGMNRKKEKETK